MCSGARHWFCMVALEWVKDIFEVITPATGIAWEQAWAGEQPEALFADIAKI